MDQSLFLFVVIMALVCVLGFFNEKVTKLTYEISLMLFSIVIGIILIGIASITKGTGFSEMVRNIQYIDLNDFLMKGVLCFMLFAGSNHMKLSDFKIWARQLTVLALVGTLLGACFYGLLIYGAAQLLGAELSLPVCLLFGSIVAPTDPIAATGILSKFGLPKNISFLIEGESLFNDGVGVALFVCFSGVVTATSSAGFFTVMAKELLGAILVGIVATLICFPMYRFTKSKTMGIFVSLLTVSLAYTACEMLHFSGAIASVICGILFSELRTRFCKEDEKEKTERFDSFWETLDVLLNSLLYVMLGLTFVNILQMEYVFLLSLVAISANFISRSGSLALSSLIMGKIPDNYNRWNFIKLFTWGGLKGGLSVALAMSTRDMLPTEVFYIVVGGTYAIVFFTTVVQGLTMKPVYQRISNSVAKLNKAS